MGFLCLHIRRFLCYTAKNSKIVSYSFAVATYPREGTETRQKKALMQWVSLQLIPARGRKPNDTRTPRTAKSCNLSPRGDGNIRFTRLLATDLKVATYPREGTETALYPLSTGRALWLQLIPARGRKPSCLPVFFVQCFVATYPREGTETSRLSNQSARSLSLQLIPARGRKR